MPSNGRLLSEAKKVGDREAQTNCSDNARACMELRLGETEHARPQDDRCKASEATLPFHWPPLPRRCCNAESTIIAV
jgi:hypothetical protein